MKNFKTVADGVVKLDNFFPKALCERVMKYSDKMCTKTLNTVDMLGPEYRNVLGYSLKNTLVSDIIYFKYTTYFIFIFFI